MASFSGPKLSNRIADDVPDIQAVLSSLAKLTPDSGNTDYPIGTKRVAETNNGYEFQQYNGTGWVTLEKWNLDAQKVDGYSASTGTAANTIPVRNANGKLPGDITGNAATASKAAALSAANPIATGGTGATTAEQARANLVVPPKNHASSSTEYGAGSSTQYGHTKTHDEPDATLTAATGHAFSPAGAAAMQGEIDDKLSTSGGTMSGSLTLSQFTFMPGGDTSYIFAQPDDVWANGARIQLNPGNLGGDLTLLAAKEGVGIGLYLKPGDGAYIDSDKVLTSAGGSMTGEIRVSNLSDFIRREVNNDRLVLLGGPHWESCSYIEMFGGDNTGRVQLNARDGTNGASFILYPTGAAQIGGRDVITSAGGTMTGAFVNATLTRNNLSGQTEIYGGTTGSNGAYIALYGQSCTDGYGQGKVLLRAANKGTVTDVTIAPGEWMYVEGKEVLCIASEWHSGTSWYRKYSDGWIEQGGTVQTGEWKTQALHIPFSNTNYTITTSTMQHADNANGYVVIRPGTKTTTSFGYCTGKWDTGQTWQNNTMSWFACGY